MSRVERMIVHKRLAQPDVIPEVTAEIGKEVIASIEGGEVGLPGIGNVVGACARQVTPNHGDEAGPGVAPVLVGHLTLRLAIQVGGSDSEDPLLDRKGLVGLRLGAGGGA